MKKIFKKIKKVITKIIAFIVGIFKSKKNNETIKEKTEEVEIKVEEPKHEDSIISNDDEVDNKSIVKKRKRKVTRHKRK